jgi:hypothetical protein
MLTKVQAAAIAEDRLCRQREQHLEARNKRARRISWWYQVPGLRILQPHEQESLFSTANLVVVKKSVFWAAYVMVLLSLAAVWQWAIPHTPAYTFPILAAVPLIFGLVMFPFVRSELRKLVQSSRATCSDAESRHS